MKPLPMLRRFEVTLTVRLVVLANDEGEAKHLAMIEACPLGGEVDARAKELALPENVVLMRRH